MSYLQIDSYEKAKLLQKIDINTHTDKHINKKAGKRKEDSQTNQQRAKRNTTKQTDTNQPENRKYSEWMSLDFDYVFPTSVSNGADGYFLFGYHMSMSWWWFKHTHTHIPYEHIYMFILTNWLTTAKTNGSQDVCIGNWKMKSVWLLHWCTSLKQNDVCVNSCEGFLQAHWTKEFDDRDAYILCVLAQQF